MNEFKIYLLTNKVNNKIYIGQTTLDLKDRMQKGEGYKNSPYLYYAIKKHGYQNFEYTILAICNTLEEANVLESKYIEGYNTRNQQIGYNLKEGGSNGKHSDESKIKIGAASAGRVVLEETRKKISAAHLGVPKPAQSEERKQENSEFMKKRHAEVGHPMQGKHHTDETKQLLREKLKDRTIPEEVLEKRRLTKLNQFLTNIAPPEVQQRVIEEYLKGTKVKELLKMFDLSSFKIIYKILKLNNIPLTKDYGKAKRGKKTSDETKAKLSQRKTEYWAKKLEKKERE